MIPIFITVLSWSNIFLNIKIQELVQQISIPKTLDLNGQSLISILIIVLSRNSKYIEIKIQELVQTDKHTGNSWLSSSKHEFYVDNCLFTEQDVRGDKVQGLDQKNRLSNKSWFSWSKHDFEEANITLEKKTIQTYIVWKTKSAHSLKVGFDHFFQCFFYEQPFNPIPVHRY